MTEPPADHVETTVGADAPGTVSERAPEPAPEPVEAADTVEDFGDWDDDGDDAGGDATGTGTGIAGGARQRWTVPDSEAGKRLDKALAAALSGLSRARIQALVGAGQVCLDGAAVFDADRRIRCGQTFDVFVPDPVAAVPLAQEMPLDVVFEDDQLVVINKPAGLVVHPAPGNPDGTLVNALLAHCRGNLSGIGGVRRPGIVHRLDKDTSGLIVVAKTNLSHVGLSRQFGDRTIGRTYTAVIWGVPSTVEGEIDRPIGRSPQDRKRMAVVARGGKPALTRYRVVRRFGTTAAVVECRLATGRTHQIRVHLAAIGHPLVGDPVYGTGRGARSAARLHQIGEPARSVITGFRRQALHAGAIGFLHPVTGQRMVFEAPLPADLAGLIEAFEEL